MKTRETVNKTRHNAALAEVRRKVKDHTCGAHQTSKAAMANIKT